MNRAKAIFVLAIIGIAAVVFLKSPQLRPEPTYKGKPMSEWQIDWINTEDAREAIDHIGTNAIPVLLNWMSYEPPSLVQGKENALAKWIPGAVRTRVHTQLNHSIVADIAFHRLGTKAAPAIPALMRLIKAPAKPFAAGQAANALSYLGQAALRPLLEQLADPNPRLRRDAIYAIGHMGYLGTNAAPALPLLVQHTRDADPGVAMHAAIALGHLNLEPEKIVPVLTNCLSLTNDQRLRLGALGGLETFGTNAIQSVPMLTRLLADPDSAVRHSAQTALKAIAPELLTDTVPDHSE